MIKFTFELITATDKTTFDELVNDRLARNYRFLTGQPLIVTRHKTFKGWSYKYSVPMMLEEEV